MGVSQLVTLLIYCVSIFLLKSYFDLAYLFSMDFLWSLGAIIACSWCPLHVLKVVKNKCYPSDHQQVTDEE